MHSHKSTQELFLLEQNYNKHDVSHCSLLHCSISMCACSVCVSEYCVNSCSSCSASGGIRLFLRKSCAMFRASMVVVFIMLFTQHQTMLLISSTTIFVSTCPFCNRALVTPVANIFLVFIQTNFFVICLYIVVVSIENSVLNDNVVFAQIPDYIIIIVLQIPSVVAVVTLGPMQSNRITSSEYRNLVTFCSNLFLWNRFLCKILYAEQILKGVHLIFVLD